MTNLPLEGALTFEHVHPLSPSTKLITIGLNQQKGFALMDQFMSALHQFMEPDSHNNPDGLGEFSIVEFGLIRKVVCDCSKGIDVEFIVISPTSPSVALTKQVIEEIAHLVFKEIESIPVIKGNKILINVTLLPERWSAKYTIGELREFFEHLSSKSHMHFKEIFGKASTNLSLAPHLSIEHIHCLSPNTKLETIGFSQQEGKDLIDDFISALNKFCLPEYHNHPNSLGEFSVVEFGLIRKIVCDRLKGIDVEFISTSPSSSNTAFIKDVIEEIAHLVFKNIEGMPVVEGGKHPIKVTFLPERWSPQYATGEVKEFIEYLDSTF